jgi:hypothetical protein
MDRISAVMGKTLKIDLVEGKMEKCNPSVKYVVKELWVEVNG